MGLKLLVGSGDKIMLATLPVLIVGVILNILFPSFFSVGGPTTALTVLSIIMLVVGVIMWLWSVALILIKVPKRQLITNGPYAVVKHPLYTGFALLVIPAIGFLLNSWLGLVVGVVMYVASRLFSRAEEDYLSKTFGRAWEEYNRSVLIPWL
jgi:protein-S-isoprenylcysteine O-methyltransferase Ste14